MFENRPVFPGESARITRQHSASLWPLPQGQSTLSSYIAMDTLQMLLYAVRHQKPMGCHGSAAQKRLHFQSCQQNKIGCFTESGLRESQRLLDELFAAADGEG
jgi:hypothetical protein